MAVEHEIRNTEQYETKQNVIMDIVKNTNLNTGEVKISTSENYTVQFSVDIYT